MQRRSTCTCTQVVLEYHFQVLVLVLLTWVLVLVLEGQVLVNTWQVLYFYFLIFKPCIVIEPNAQNSPENCGKINTDIGNTAVKSFTSWQFNYLAICVRQSLWFSWTPHVSFSCTVWVSKHKFSHYDLKKSDPIATIFGTNTSDITGHYNTLLNFCFCVNWKNQDKRNKH